MRNRMVSDALAFGLCAAISVAVATQYSQITANAQSSTDQGQQTAQKMPTPVLDTHHLMELFNRPVYEYLKKSVAEQPSKQESWSEISNRGMQVAEVANLVALRKRPDSDPRWHDLAAGLQHAGVQLSEAAKSHDWPATKQAYHQVIGRCNSCHQTKAPDKAPQLGP